MGAGHRYELVKGSEDAKDEPVQHTTTSTAIVISWWKFVLCNLLAASLGAGAMFLIARNFLPTQSSTTTTSTTTAASSVVAAAVSAATSTSTSASVSADVELPTTSVESVAVATSTPNPLAGIILDCGGNPEQAREKGCVYDVMMQDWVPEPCYDSVLTEQYLAEGNWTWYTAGDGSSTISLEEMRKGEHGAAWMATSYHFAHCVFSWLKIIRALRNDRGISQELLSYDHVLHCSHGALRANSEDEGLGVRAPTNYAKCALYDTWIQDLIPDKHDSTQR